MRISPSSGRAALPRITKQQCSMWRFMLPSSRFVDLRLSLSLHVCVLLLTPPPRQVLRKGDVLMEFDGVPIANDGTVPFRARERIFFTAFTTLKPTGSTARVKVRVLHMLGFGVWGCRGDQLTQLVPRQLSIVV